MTSSDRLSPKDHRKWWKTVLVSMALGIGALSLQGCLDDDDDDPDVADEVVWTPSDVAETQYGQVRGSLDEADDMLVWRGIPYAAPPVGDLRFAPPEAPAQWGDVLTTVDHR